MAYEHENQDLLKLFSCAKLGSGALRCDYEVLHYQSEASGVRLLSPLDVCFCQRGKILCPAKRLGLKLRFLVHT
jgi:hypothetical protein